MVRNIRCRALTATLLVVLAGACDGGSPGRGAGCDEPQQERFDPASGTHVLAGAPDPGYRSDPPTSGPHVPGPVLSGVRDEPLSRPAQVGQLEAGAVLLQHRDLDADALAALEELAGDGVVVLPNADLPAPVVATAWLFKLTCGDVDADALGAFVDEHLGQGPGTDG